MKLSLSSEALEAENQPSYAPLTLLETPTDGQILYHGQNVLEKGYDLTQYREKLGMVFQSFNLFENLNVPENTIVAQTTVLKRERTEAEKIAKENLEKVGMGERYWQAKPKQLSGGQKQRGSHRSCPLHESGRHSL